MNENLSVVYCEDIVSIEQRTCPEGSYYAGEPSCKISTDVDRESDICSSERFSWGGIVIGIRLKEIPKSGRMLVRDLGSENAYEFYAILPDSR